MNSPQERAPSPAANSIRSAPSPPLPAPGRARLVPEGDTGALYAGKDLADPG